MVVSIALLIVLVAVAVAAYCGGTADSRDADYGVGAVLRHARRGTAR